MCPGTLDTPFPAPIPIDGEHPYHEYSLGADDDWQDEETAIFSYGLEFADDAEVDMAIEGFVAECGDEATKPTKCGLCPDQTPENDRLPFGADGVAHWRCLAQLTIGVRKAVVRVEKRGPWARR